MATALDLNAGAFPEAEPEVCFHCGLEVAGGLALRVEVLGAPRLMCCIGCQAVAEMLVTQGLENWYRERVGPTGTPARVVPDVLRNAAFLVNADEDFDVSRRDGALEVSLLVEGMTCPACAWIIERHLTDRASVLDARVNLTSGRVRVSWEAGRANLADIVEWIAEIGFVAWADRPDRAAEISRRERKAALIRLGLAGLATMNVMTYAAALYAGALEGMSAGVQQLLRFMCWFVTTPVVFISARPFFESALRDLRAGRAGMDLPVALAIGGTYAVSAWAVMKGTGEVYFESVCMFTFFLGLGRFLEMNVRHRSASLAERLRDANPLVARRIVDGREEVVDAGRIVPGDRLSVHPGDVIPVDGTIIEGETAIEEAVLTGEPWPRRVGPGMRVRAGCMNAESPVVLEATHAANESTLAALVRMIDGAQSDRPRIARFADRLASVFVLGVLGLAAATALVWSVHDPDRALWVSLSVLVATCPCALSLATPAAFAASMDGLAREGFLITRGHVLEAFPRIDRMLFDKTGTLTRGEAALEKTILLGRLSEDESVAVARALERESEHVLARAFRNAREGKPSISTGTQNFSGCGVEGHVDGERWRIGRPDWAVDIAADPRIGFCPDDDSRSWILLANTERAVTWFGIGDRTRHEAADALAALRDDGIRLELLSGDPSPAAARVAVELAIERGVPAASPAGKLDRVRRAQRTGEVVAIVGDGLNDGPVMRAADVSVAMGSGCDLTRLHADAVLLADDLSLLPRAVHHARKTKRVIAQNFAWALGYNLCVLPLAVSGHLAPWLAALGMSLSSLIVALNATRLRHVGVAK